MTPSPPTFAPRRTAVRRIAAILLWALILLAAIRFVHILGVAARHETGEFVAYYGSAKALRVGLDVATFYDDATFWSYTRRYGPGAKNIYYPNPPPTAVFLLPLSLWDFETARILWLLGSTLAFFTTLRILVGALDLTTPAIQLFLLYALVNRAVIADLIHGQIYLFMSLAQAVLLIQLHRGHSASPGILAGVCLATKFTAPHLAILGVLRRFRRFALAMVVTVLGLVLATAVLLGSSAWIAFLRCLDRFSADPYLVHPTFQSLRGLVFRFFADSPLLGTKATVNAPWLAPLLFAGVSLGAVILGLWLYHRSGSLPSAAYLIAISVVLSPFAQDYTYCQLLPVAALACKQIVIDPRRVTSAGLLFALALLGLPLSRLLPMPTHALWIFAYPMVFGAFLLLVSLLLQSRVTPAILSQDSPPRGAR